MKEAIENFKDEIQEQDVLLTSICTTFEITKNSSDHLHKDEIERFCEINGRSYKEVSDKLKEAGCVYRKNLQIDGKQGRWDGLKKKANIPSFIVEEDGLTENGSLGF